MRRILRNTALLALPSLINAVALSDMTPRATGLPQKCEDIYTAQIAGCAVSDFQTQKCSQSCIGALTALVSPIVKACGGQGVQGENLVVAFLAGVGPEQVCHNINAQTSTKAKTTSKTHTPTPKTHKTHTKKPKIVSSTLTASSSPLSSSLIVDPSSTPQTKHHTTHKTHKQHKHTKAAHVSSSSSAAPPPLSSKGAGAGAASSSSQTASSHGSYQTNMHDGSGGGSPFDTQGNLRHNAASSFSISALTALLSAGAAAILFSLR